MIGNHDKSLPARSGRQPNTKLPSWEEAPIDEEMTEINSLLNEIEYLKKQGLTAQAITINFTYMYVGANDPNREISHLITEPEI